ncbi:MAG: glycosyltransferase family 4 protein [Chitinophagaceae bacterium]|jgi:glycosyltransferase involved in cell wall biosynthesis|nr:glycosyltransferase family 4 protein [Chitinophagaceae bacterium]
MRIGFDAKRIYHNSSGLGNYGRNLLNGLLQYYPDFQYHLYNPKPGNLFQTTSKNVHEIQPQSFLYKCFPSVWRSRGLSAQLPAEVDLYHGLSNELPFGIHRSALASVVSIHDLIFEKFPEYYTATDRRIYRKKFSYSSHAAKLVLACSELTKRDLIHHYQIPAEKIKVHYQSCSPRFYQALHQDELASIRKTFSLPDAYVLYVGSIIERKNLLSLVQAFSQWPSNDLQLLVVGQGSVYRQQVENFIRQSGLEHRIIFMNDHFPYPQLDAILPALYQMASCFVYPSFYEGFGIPVLEAHASNCPVITSGNLSSMSEISGDAAAYIKPSEPDSILHALQSVLKDKGLSHQMREKGKIRAERFNLKSSTDQLIQYYQDLI